MYVSIYLSISISIYEDGCGPVDLGNYENLFYLLPFCCLKGKCFNKFFEQPLARKLQDL